MVDITITNPVSSQDPGEHAGNRMAQDNIHQRLRLAYGARAGLEAALEGDTYRVSMRFPEASTA
jgi:two-component system sensor histidine kinase AlgZ